MAFFRLVRSFHEKSISSKWLQVRCSAHSHAREQALTDTRRSTRTPPNESTSTERPIRGTRRCSTELIKELRTFLCLRIIRFFLRSRRELSLCERTMCRWMLLPPMRNKRSTAKKRIKRKPLTSATRTFYVCEIYILRITYVLCSIHTSVSYARDFFFQVSAKCRRPVFCMNPI